MNSDIMILKDTKVALITENRPRNLDIAYVTQSLFTKTIVDFSDIDIKVPQEKLRNRDYEQIRFCRIQDSEE